MKAHVSIRFVFRKPKRFIGSGMAPDMPGILACNIQAGSLKYAQISTHIRVLYGDWDAHAQRVRGRTSAARTANETLIKTLDRLNALAADLDRQQKPITPQRLKSLYLRNGAVLSFLELFDEFISERKGLVGLEIAPHTLAAPHPPPQGGAVS